MIVYASLIVNQGGYRPPHHHSKQKFVMQESLMSRGGEIYMQIHHNNLRADDPAFYGLWAPAYTCIFAHVQCTVRIHNVQACIYMYIKCSHITRTSKHSYTTYFLKDKIIREELIEGRNQWYVIHMVPHGLKEWTRILSGNNHSAPKLSFHRFLLENDIFCTGENIIGRMEVSPLSHKNFPMLFDIMHMHSMLIFHLYNQVHVGLLLHAHNLFSMH